MHEIHRKELRQTKSYSDYYSRKYIEQYNWQGRTVDYGLIIYHVDSRPYIIWHMTYLWQPLTVTLWHFYVIEWCVFNCFDS